MIELRRHWLLIAVPVVVAFAFVTPPFQAPDEVGHYWYANAIARGHLPKVVSGKPSAHVPRGVRDIVLVTWVSTAGRPEAKVGTARISNAAAVPLGPDEVPVTFPAFYTPVPYAVTAFACWFGNLLNLRPLVSFYFGRLLNAAAMILIAEAAVRRLAAGGARIAAVALLPMALYLAASFSPDAITFGVAAYATALALTPEDTRAYWLQLTIAAVLLALCKPVYFLVPLVIVARRRGTWRIAAVVVAITAGLTLSALTAERNWFPMRPDAATNISAQMKIVQAGPARFVALAVHDYAQRWREYAEQMVGRLGWLDIRLPQPLVWITLVLLLSIGVIAPAPIGIATRIAALAIVAASCLIISMSQYLSWTPVAANEIAGIQGRYLLPLLPLALSIIGSTRPRPRAEQWFEVLFAIGVSALNIAGVIAVLHRYY